MGTRQRHRVDEDGLTDGDRHVDATLHRLLEPRPGTVERLVRSALRQDRASARVRWWPRLAVAAALVALAVFLAPRLLVEPPAVKDESEPARISISNEEGFVTISSSAGSKWILVPGDDS